MKKTYIDTIIYGMLHASCYVKSDIRTYFNLYIDRSGLLHESQYASGPLFFLYVIEGLKLNTDVRIRWNACLL